MEGSPLPRALTRAQGSDEKELTPVSFIGIDFGTTHCKAGAFSRDGRELAIATARTPAHSDAAGTVWYPDEIWSTIVRLLQQVIAQLNPDDAVEGISTSSVGESFVLMDGKGEAVFPVIAWYDTRSMAERDWWQGHFGEERLRAITGLPLDPIYSASKLMWIRTHAPDAYRRGRRALLMADWIVYKLCGAQLTDFSQATRTMVFDLGKREWSFELMDAAGLPHDLFGEAVPSSYHAGGVLPDVARLTGLKPGVPCFTGGQDHVVATLGAGLVDAGRMLNSTGTAETALTVVEGDITPMMTPGLTLGAHVIRDAYYAMGTMRAGGASIEWAIRELLPGVSAESRYEAFMQEVAGGCAAETGLLFFPLLRGSLMPVNQPSATGGFWGLRDTHTRRDMLRAALEGVCFEAAYMIDHLRTITGVQPQRIIAVGGGTKNPFWLQTKSDALNMPVDVPAVGEAALLGAALLAGIGAGVYPDARAAGRVTGLAATYHPDGRRHEVLHRAFERYVAARQLMLDFWE